MPFYGLPSERFLFDFVPGSVVNFVNQTWEIEMNTEGDSFTYLWLYEILQMTRKMIGAVKYRISRKFRTCLKINIKLLPFVRIGKGYAQHNTHT